MKSNEIKQYTPLLIELLKRDIKVKYRKSVLGVLWSVLNPLFMMIILSVVFSTLFKNNVENYPTYIFSGQLIYNFFSEATTSSMSAIVDNASLIKKIYVPKYLFVLARICSSMINLMATLSALFCVMLVLRIDLSYRLYEGVVALILLTLFSTGVGLVLSAIAVKFRDMMHLYSVFLTALMYLCPIIYTMIFAYLYAHVDKKKYFIVEDDGMYQKIDIDEILYFSIIRRGCEIHILQNGTGKILRTRKRIQEIEEELRREYFCRIHKSFLVNPRYITEVKKSEIKMDNNEILSVSKARRKTFEDMFAEYLSYRK